MSKDDGACEGTVGFIFRFGSDAPLPRRGIGRGIREFVSRRSAVGRRAGSRCPAAGGKGGLQGDGATPTFFPFAHEKLEADAETLNAVTAWLEEIKPDILVTHWPLDTHPNHQVASSLVWRSYRARGGWNLYFFEVMTDQQTLGFPPTLYLNIESVRAVKREACYCHASQGPAAFWPVHEAMHRRRGAESGVSCAEAYYLVEAKTGCPLLPVSFVGRKK